MNADNIFFQLARTAFWLETILSKAYLSSDKKKKKDYLSVSISQTPPMVRHEGLNEGPNNCLAYSGNEALISDERR